MENLDHDLILDGEFGPQLLFSGYHPLSVLALKAAGYSDEQVLARCPGLVSVELAACEEWGCRQTNTPPPRRFARAAGFMAQAFR